MTRRNRNRNQTRAVQNVRVLDPLGGQDGAKVDRQLNSLQNSSNQIQVLCSESNDVSINTVANAGNIGWSQILLFDDFVSMAQQYDTFRIRSIRYDVYDINPTTGNAAIFSTFHTEANSSVQPVYTFANVVDGVDSQIVPPGTGKISFTWMGHTTLEKGFVNTITSPSPEFGGLRYYVFAGGATTAKFRIVTKAVVDFRGRR